MTRDLTDLEALDALAWQIELGADEAMSEEPINRLEAPPEPKTTGKVEPAAETPAETFKERSENGPDDAGAARIAAACANLVQLQEALRAFDGCSLKKGARNTVFCDGNPEARVMIIGEAPSREEDQSGTPFVGRSGRLLDKMLAAIDLARDAETPQKAVYITNVMPWRPPQNRDPSPEEILMMRAFLMRHIELKSPEFIVTMGNSATKTVLDVTTGIARMRGTWSDHTSIPVLPMFHPDALLRDPSKKKEAWADLLSLKARLL